MKPTVCKICGGPHLVCNRVATNGPAVEFRPLTIAEARQELDQIGDAASSLAESMRRSGVGNFRDVLQLAEDITATRKKLRATGGNKVKIAALERRRNVPLSR